MIQTSIRQQLCHGTMMIGLGILGYPSDEKKTVDSPFGQNHLQGFHHQLPTECALR
jgi:hypothetical protein